MLCGKCKKEGDFKVKKNGKTNKYCNSCLEKEKTKRERHKEYHKQYRDGIKSEKIRYNKEYKQVNKDYISEYNKEYGKNNRDKINKNRHKRMKVENYRKKINKQRREYYDNDELYKLTCVVRSRIYGMIKNKSSSSQEILGCTYEDYKIYIENKFQEGMSWNNHGEWEIDHIYPLSKAKDDKHLLQLFHYTNTQPLWNLENKKKGSSIP